MLPVLSGIVALSACLAPATTRAAEHVTLRNGFAVDCARQEAEGDRVRLYLLPQKGASASASASQNFLEVEAAEIARIDPLPEAPPAYRSPATVGADASSANTSSRSARAAAQNAAAQKLSANEMAPLLADAQSRHNVDADLLWSVVQAESAGHVRAVSPAGAQGLMQLMPGTAASLGVADAFAPSQNIGGGAAYLDQMLRRYHDNLALALAAYNAGPAAVDRWHGIPPYRETRSYVARVIHQFNARKRLMAAK